MASSETLVVELRNVLNHLYDPTFLAQSALLDALRLGTRVNPPLALQSAIIQAIEGIGAGHAQPEQSRSRRHYQVLDYRYVQQFTQADVAHRLGISSRHLRREQDAAVRTLAVYLSEQYGLSPDKALSPPAANVSLRSGSAAPEAGPRGRPANVAQVIAQASELVSCMAEHYQVRLCAHVQEDATAVSIPSTVLKPLLLDVLSAAIRATTGGVITMTVAHDGDWITITAVAQPDADKPLDGGWDAQELHVAAQLAQAHGGALELLRNKQGLVARLTLPKASNACVLAIEDNEDALQLWTRYLAGSPYRLVGERDPLQAVEQAARLLPAAIVLDVMLPGMDGWDLLGRLQYHPATRDIPVIVCTIHPQKELALSLGAQAFVRKPTNRRAFLAALDACTCYPASIPPR